MPGIERGAGQQVAVSDAVFGWLRRDLSELHELAIVVGDACHCCPGLRENVEEVVAMLGEDALCVVSLAALIEGADGLSRLRLERADARVAIFGCKEHDHIEKLEEIGNLDSTLSLDRDQLSAHASQIKGMLQGLLRDQRLANSDAEIEGLRAAAQPPTRAFSNLLDVAVASAPAQVVASAVPQTPLPSASAATAGAVAPQLSRATAPPSPSTSIAAPTGTFAATSIDPASAPSQSYFSRGGQAQGAYFARPKQSNVWKWMFLLLVGGIGLYGLYHWWNAPSTDTPIDREGRQSGRAVVPQRPVVRREAQPPGSPVREPVREPVRARPRPAPRKPQPRRVAPPPRPVVSNAPQRRALLRQSRRINVNWIGGVCSTAQDCSYPLALCLPTKSVGFCTRQCEKLCPDRHRSTDTTSFCVDSPLVRSEGKIPLGLCLAACDDKLFPGTGCRIGMWCRKLSWRRYPKQKKRVCVPIAK